MMPNRDSSLATFTLEQATFRIADQILLHPTSYTFAAGKMTALVGHNGSGKSTLLKLLSRQIIASSGQIHFADLPLHQWYKRAFARQVAFLPQRLPMAEGLTVHGLVSLGRYPWHGAFGRYGKHDRQHVETSIIRVGLTDFADRQVDSLSGGERQRAWLAMILAQESRCLLLDEPTSALDISHQIEVLTLIQQLSRQHGLTIVVVLHDINMAARYCDYIIALRQGSLIADGKPIGIMHSDVLEQIYGIPMVVLPHPYHAIPVTVVI